MPLLPTRLLVFAATGALIAISPAGAKPADVPAGNAEQIVVTGTRTPRTQRSSPIRTDIIGERILKAAGARNLADALEYLPGVRAESNCQNCNTTEIQLLGLGGAYNQILLDGLPLVTGVASVYGVEQIPAVLVDRVEVVKGGASALYGPGAIAGVVNVLPVRAVSSGIRANANYDLLKGRSSPSGALLGSFAFGGEGGILTGYSQRENSPAVDFDDDGYSELARRKLTVVGARGVATLAEGLRLDLGYQYTDERRRGGNRLDQPAYLANVAEEINSRIHRGTVSLTGELREDRSITGVYAISRVDRASFYGGLGDVEADDGKPAFDADSFAEAAAVSRNQYGRTDDLLHFAELRGQAALARHALLLGIQYRHEDVNDLNLDVDGNELGELASGAFSTLGAFVQDEWSLSDSLRFVVGARVDKSSELSGAIFSPRIGIWYSPASALVLRGNYSTGFRAPEIFNEDLHISVLGAAPVRVRNAPGLEAETAQSWSAGFDWRPRFGDGAFTMDGQAYYTRLKDTFFLGNIQEGGNGELFQVRDNVGGSSVVGAEISASYQVSERLRLLLGGAYLCARYADSQLIFDNGERQISTRDYLKSPRFAGIAQAIWEMAERLDLFVALKFTGPMDVLNNRIGELARTPRFLVADASVTRHIPLGGGQEADITLGVRNITDSRQSDLEVGALRDSDYVYGPRQPRTLFLRLSAHY